MNVELDRFVVDDDFRRFIFHSNKKIYLNKNCLIPPSLLHNLLKTGIHVMLKKFN